MSDQGRVLKLWCSQNIPQPCLSYHHGENTGVHLKILIVNTTTWFYAGFHMTNWSLWILYIDFWILHINKHRSTSQSDYMFYERFHSNIFKNDLSVIWSRPVTIHSLCYWDAACCLLGVLTTGAASLDGVEPPLVVFPATPPGGESSSAVEDDDRFCELCWRAFNSLFVGLCKQSHRNEDTHTCTRTVYHFQATSGTPEMGISLLISYTQGPS